MTNASPSATQVADGSGSHRILLRGYVITQILGTAVRLGIFDALAGGPIHLQALCERTGVAATELRRF